ncbi:hypothetical protein NA898_15145 [Proteus cibi]|uniref:Inner membrane protein yafU n=1 Tax=Proteus cibi TaxID=2050966 RepID=A0ABU6EIH9_9GAMM|nr:hypothetical protein [Proteus cibi]EST57020.1 hypothetical protein K151_3287 [Proteus hauseri ZMd44]MEB6858296.1 hypothetical protein [Proteus cibi]MEB7089877.1 hypothetical protein [Proteus cibi]
MGYIYDTTVIDWDREEQYNNKKRIERILNDTEDDENVAALITIEEADYVLKNLSTPTPYKSSKDTLFSVGDIASSYSGNIYELYRVERIINEFRNINITATEYVGKNGNVYIRISGHAGVRTYLNATRYLANNPRIIYMGVGTQGMNSVSTGGVRFAIVFSAAYRVVELIFRDEYDLTNFFVNITMDMAKLAIATQVSASIVGVLTTLGIIAGGSVIIVSVGIFLLGVAISYFLYKLDDEFKISETIIKNLKSYRDKKPETPYHPDQFFTQWGRLSRG